MRCNHCRQTMHLTSQVQERNTRQSWYLCPLCQTEQTVCERDQPGRGLDLQETDVIGTALIYPG